MIYLIVLIKNLKSKKEVSYIYDYEINTSQDIGKADGSEPDDSTNYELSDDGICPKY